MKTLKLFTRRFPYGQAESFLETEILYLCREFDEIEIFPLQKTKEYRKLPRNVKVNTELSKLHLKATSKILNTIISKRLWCLILNKRFSNLLYLFRYASRINSYYRFIKRNKSTFQDTLLYSYWFNEAVSALCTLKKEKVINSIIVSRAHRYDIYENQVDTVPFWPNRMMDLELLNKVFPISDNGAKYLINKYGYSEKIFISRLGVPDSQHITTRSSSNNLNIVSVSRIAEVKRVDKIFECINLFAQNNPHYQITWFHFGGGPQLIALKKHTEENKKDNLEVKLVGHVYNADVYAFYLNNPVDFIINLSSSEGIPVSLMEAQSFGIPVIATDVGGNSEIVNSETGILVEKDFSIESVSKQISELIKKEYHPLVIKGIWLETFNAESNYSNFAKMISTLVYHD